MKEVSYNTIHSSDISLVKRLNLHKYDAYVAGGAALAWYQHKSAAYRDIDVWFTKLDNFHRMNEDFRLKDSPRFETENAVTYRMIDHNNVYKVQLIKLHTGTTEEILNKFDFSICQVATDGSSWFLGEHFVQDLKDKRLRVLRHHPKIIRRLLKYWANGYKPDDSTLLDIMNNKNTLWNFDSEENGEDYDNSF